MDHFYVTLFFESSGLLFPSQHHSRL